MLQEWRTVFNGLQQDRRVLLSTLNGLSETQLAFKPTPHSWSILQVLHHLTLVESALTNDARERLLQPPQPVTPRENFMAFVVRCVMNSSLKIKTPPAAKTVIPPQAASSLADTASRWSKTRDDLELLLTSLPPERHATALFRHPVSGLMTATQGLNFIKAHHRHHDRQLKNLLKH